MEDCINTQGEGSHLQTKERPQKQPTLLMTNPWFWAFGLQNCEKIKLADIVMPSPIECEYMSHPVETSWGNYRYFFVVVEIQ